jgi:glucosamine-6-phosphate deaminase
LELDLTNLISGGMDEWYMHREVPQTHPLSFARADRELCFDRIRPDSKMPESNIHFPKADTSAYIKS